MKTKKWSVLIIVMAMLTAMLSACGGDKNKENNASQTPAPSSSNAKPSGEKVELNMLIAESILGGIQDQLIEQFESSHPNIKVKVESIPDGSIFDTLRIRISSGEVPDLYQVNIGHVTTQMADQAGYLADLTDMEAMKGYAESVKNASTVNGKIANFSMGVGVLGLPYDKAALAAAGYSEPPKTWEELMALGKKMKDSGKDLLVYSSKWETGIGNVFHWAFGAQALKDPAFKEAYLANKVDWSIPENRAVLQQGFERFKELNQYVRTGSFTNEYSIAQQAFTSGESAMVLGGTWEAGTYRGLNADLDLGFMNLPYMDEAANPYIFVPEDGLALNAQSKHIEEAKTFLNWLFGEAGNYVQVQKAKGNMSSITGVGELDASYSDVPNWLNTDRVVSFANTGPIPSPTWIALGQAAQQYTFDGKLDSAINKFVKAYDGTKSK